MTALERTVRRARRRLSWLQFYRVFLRFMFWALIASCALISAFKFVPESSSPYLPLLVVLLVPLPVGVGVALFRRYTLFQAATATDDKLNLKERLSSAVALQDEDAPMVEALQHDAESYARGVNVRRAFPFRPPREIRYMLLPLAALVCVELFVPEIDLRAKTDPRIPTVTLPKKEVREAAKKLSKSSEEIRDEAERRQLKRAFKLAEQLKKAGEELQAKPMQKREALAKLYDVRKRIHQRREELTSAAAIGDSLKAAMASGMTKDLAVELKAGNLKAARGELQKLMDKLGKGQLGDRELKQLQKELARLSGSLSTSQPLAAALKNAAGQLRGGNCKGALKALAMASSDIEAISRQLIEMDLLDKAMLGIQDTQLAMFDSEMRKKASFPGLGDKARFCRNCGKRLRKKSGVCSKCGRSDCCGCCSGGSSPGGSSKGQKPGQAQGGQGSKSGQGKGGRTGPGMGGPGRGKGRQMPDPGNPAVDFQPWQPKGQLDSDGLIVARKAVPGRPHGDETTLEASDVFAGEAGGVEDAIEKEKIPLGYREYMREYFSLLPPE